MAKAIAVSDDVYELLSKIKLPEESFSDVIRRSVRRGRLSDIAGSGTITGEEWEKVKQMFKSQQKLDEERKKRLMRLMRQ